MKRPIGQRTTSHHALRLRPIDNLPRFANALAGGNVFAEELAQFSAAPDALLENRFEDKRCSKGCHFSEDQTANISYIELIIPRFVEIRPAFLA